MKELKKQVVNTTLKNEMDLVNKRELRDRLVGNEAVFNDKRVKALGAFLLPKDFGATTEQVANYFEVDKATVKYHMYTNQEHGNELQENGLHIEMKDNLLSLSNQLKTKRGGFDILDEDGRVVGTGSNKGIMLFTRRSILNLAMMLEGSQVAKTIRSVLLDATESKTVVKEIVKQQDSYMIEDPIERAKAWIREQEERQALQLENKQQQQIIGELKPKADYTDKILKSKSLMTITAIAKDYGMSGNGLNNKLHELGVQYKQGKQWLLYSKYHACGYTHSETITYKHKNGLEDTTLHTKWTQKGRLFLYELLKQNGILPMIEKEYE